MLYAHILFCCHIATFPYNCIHSYITTEQHNHIATQPQRIPARKAIARWTLKGWRFACLVCACDLEEFVQVPTFQVPTCPGNMGDELNH
jgi:hypothetical protein